MEKKNLLAFDYVIAYIKLPYPSLLKGLPWKESVHNAGDARGWGSIPGKGNGYPPTPIFLPTGVVGLIPGLGRSPGGGNDNPLQYSCLENPMDRGTWRAAVRRVTESDMTEAT